MNAAQANGTCGKALSFEISMFDYFRK
ncbi:hypothetical protein CGLO_17795 [Colletotrichum gloeosporioides Cg-14]|uniref:Uncharacterized protein n=1 Tax=Colletotrichum gloeosporioides (strain Cg-14) TaxID=1237896 RepID=T0JSW0_COLGC|nr:hypothetical protein CGLO_17795 [Colletotrichum gloeosporioides Cg-14]